MTWLTSYMYIQNMQGELQSLMSAVNPKAYDHDSYFIFLAKYKFMCIHNGDNISSTLQYVHGFSSG